MTGLEAADKMPLNGTGQELSLLGELLSVVFAKVQVLGRCLVEGENVICRLELGDGHEPDLKCDEAVSNNIYIYFLA